MTRSKSWTIWRVHRCVLCLIAGIGLGALALFAQGDPALQFVKIGSDSPGVYRAPVRIEAGESLALRATGLHLQDGLELRLYGLVNPSGSGGSQNNQVVQLAVWHRSELSTHAVGPDLVVPLDRMDTHGALELTAALFARNGTRLGSVATLTVDPAASGQAAPSWLQSAIATGSPLLDRFTHIYQVIRNSPEPRSVFTVSFDNGNPISGPVALSLPRTQFRALALSSTGKRLAWVVQVPGGYELWTSDLDKLVPERIASSEQEITTPVFAREDMLLYVNQSALLLTKADGTEPPKTLNTPLRSISRIYRVNEGAEPECIVTAESPEIPGFEVPFLAKISVPHAQVAVSRLPLSPYYGAYSAAAGKSPLFYAGSEGGVEGIYYVRPNAPEYAITLYKVRSPGLVAVAGDGSRIVFAGNP